MAGEGEGRLNGDWRSGGGGEEARGRDSGGDGFKEVGGTVS